jgi:hypothetical protein
LNLSGVQYHCLRVQFFLSILLFFKSYEYVVQYIEYEKYAEDVISAL